jgi:thioredoxin 1
MSSATKVLTNANFDEEVLVSDLPVVVDFWAEWCGPCKLLAPMLDQIAEERRGSLVVGKLDVDDNQATARRFEVLGIPSLLVFKDGELVHRRVGVSSKRALLAELDAVLGVPATGGSAGAKA